MIYLLSLLILFFILFLFKNFIIQFSKYFSVFLSICLLVSIFIYYKNEELNRADQEQKIERFIRLRESWVYNCYSITGGDKFDFDKPLPMDTCIKYLGPIPKKEDDND